MIKPKFKIESYFTNDVLLKCHLFMEYHPYLGYCCQDNKLIGVANFGLIDRYDFIKNQHIQMQSNFKNIKYYQFKNFYDLFDHFLFKMSE